jgi:uncharacterized protein YbjT (DUF2867 family)
MKKVLLTGASGFVGRAVLEKLRHDSQFESVIAVRKACSASAV